MYFQYSENANVPAGKLLNYIRDEFLKVEAPNKYPLPGGGNPGDEQESVWTVVAAIEDEENSVDYDGWGFSVSKLVLKRGAQSADLANGIRQLREFFLVLTNDTIGTDLYGTYTAQVLASDNPEDTYQILEEHGNGANDRKDYPGRSRGPIVTYQCVDETMTDTERSELTSVHVFLNIDNDRVALVTFADPVVNFDDYVKSFLYCGTLEPFDENIDSDVGGNVLLTTGCEVDEPTLQELSDRNPSEYFGVHTSAGNNTLQMLTTKSGVKFQKHYAAFITQSPKPGQAYICNVVGDTGIKLEAQGFQASRWTEKYHLSPVYVVHLYEGYRGQMKDVISVVRHNILHLDRLVVEVDECKYPHKPWKQEVYRYFDLDSTNNFFRMSPNQGTAVAILSEVRY